MILFEKSYKKLQQLIKMIVSQTVSHFAGGLFLEFRNQRRVFSFLLFSAIFYNVFFQPTIIVQIN